MHSRLNSTMIKTAVSAVVASLLLPLAANAQYQSLRNPLIPGAPSAPAGAAPYEGQPPPIGQGYAPPPVTPGMWGAPELLPWNSNIPANQIDQPSSQVNTGADPTTLASPYTLGSQLYAPAPPSTPGQDNGPLSGPMDFYPPPAALVNINAQGGMPGDFAPQQRWGGQTTRDLGRRTTQGSTLQDYGEKLTEKPNLKMYPQGAEDGPRNTYAPDRNYTSNRDPNLGNAQATTDLHGNRTLFKGSNQRSRQTIAPF